MATRQSTIGELLSTNFDTKVAAEFFIKLGGKDYRLVGRLVRIGRALDNDIVLDDKSCSRYHALLTIDGTKVILEDLKSRNGIKVNGKKVPRAELQQSSEIHIGDVAGSFYQHIKKGDHHAEATAAGRGRKKKSKIKIADLKLLERFKDLGPKARLAVVAAVPFTLFFLLIVFSAIRSGFQSNMAEEEAPSGLDASRIVDVVIPKAKLERCQDFDDLGNYRQARKCLEALPMNSDVFRILDQVIKTQRNMTAKRFKEGQEAHNNYYDDLALIKLQEVLLISDDSSEIRPQAEKLIIEIQERKKRQ